MRLLILSLVIIFCSCNGDNTPIPPKTPSSDLPQQETKTKKVEGFASPEAIKESELPMYGKGKANFTIKVKGAAPGPSNLIGFYADENLRVDETQIDANGNITYTCASCNEGQTTYPQGLYYVQIANEKYLQVILGEDQEFVLETTIDNPDGNMVVKGSDENEAFFTNLKYEKANQPKFAEIGEAMKAAGPNSPEYDRLKGQQKKLVDARLKHLDEIYTKYPNTLMTSFKKAGQDPILREDILDDKEKIYFYRQEFWEDVDWSDRRLIRTPVIKNKLAKYFEQLTPQNHDSIIASAFRLSDQLLMHPEYYMYIVNWVVKKYEPTKTSIMDPEYVFVKMMQRYFTRDRAFWENPLVVDGFQKRAHEMSKSFIGYPGPDVISKDLQGKTHRLLDSKQDYIVTE